MASLSVRLGDRMLQAALSVERRQAGFIQSSSHFSFGDIAYLRRESDGARFPEAIVMLHGAASDKMAWVRLAKQLRVKLPLVAPDLPGHGDSSFEHGLRYDIQSQAERVREFLLALGIGRAHLVANSMGGAIALRLAAGFPELVRSLVLIDAAGAESTPSWLRQQLANTGINPMIEVKTGADYRAMMKIGMEKPPYIPGFLVPALARAFIKRSEINFKITQDIEQNLDQKAILPKVVAETLIIWGAADKVLHVNDADFLHRQLRHSQKLVLEGLGHVPMVESPKQVGAACNAFYAKLDSIPTRPSSAACGSWGR